MVSTSYVDFASGARGIAARTTAAAAAAPDLTAEEDRLIQAILQPGALSDTAFKVAADAGMNVKVGATAKSDLYAVSGAVAGQGIYLVRLDATPFTVTIQPADPAQARIDEIYLVVADSAYDGGAVSLPRIGRRTGTPGSGSPGPDATWKAFALLAQISVPAAASSIAAGNITDKRTPAALTRLLGGEAVPVGQVIEWDAPPTTPLPWNYLELNGQAVSRTAYPLLFAHYGTYYGLGDGSTTFNLPDRRGRTPVGRDVTQPEFDTVGETGGAKTHTLAVAEMPSHNHNGWTGLEDLDHTHIYQQPGLIPSTTYPGGAPGFLVSGMTMADTSGSTSLHRHSIPAQGGGGAHNNLQPYAVTRFLVKAV